MDRCKKVTLWASSPLEWSILSSSFVGPLGFVRSIDSTPITLSSNSLFLGVLLNIFLCSLILQYPLGVLFCDWISLLSTKKINASEWNMGICLLSSFLLTRYNWISLPNSIKNDPTDGSLLFGHDTGFRISSWWFFGPAYPQKTESVKALGHQLGHFVHVFKYNETGFLTVCVRHNFARGSISFRTYFNLVLLAGWSLGLFWWISPFGRANAVSLLKTSADHPGSFEIVEGKRERRQFSDQTSWKASQSLAKYGCSLYTESWLRWPFQPSRKFEKKLPFSKYDYTWPKAHCRSHAFLPGLQKGCKIGPANLKIF